MNISISKIQITSRSCSESFLALAVSMQDTVIPLMESLWKLVLIRP